MLTLDVGILRACKIEFIIICEKVAIIAVIGFRVVGRIFLAAFSYFPEKKQQQQQKSTKQKKKKPTNFLLRYSIQD